MIRCFSSRCFHVLTGAVLFSIILQAEPREGSSESGQLRGKLIDQATRQPLISANVIIEGSDKGAATDADGQYIISSVSPGIYNVRYMMMGYETRYVNKVVVNPGRTTWQQIELVSTVLEGESVSVTAGYFQSARDAIVSSQTMDFEEVRSDPGSAEDIQRVMQTLPAVVSQADQSNEIIIRGGMPGENLFVMDDIEIPNPNHFQDQGESGGPINMINPYFVRKIDFYAGAFPARYGDRASSVMDISLREGNREGFTGYAYMGMAGAGVIAEGPLQKGKGSYLISGRKSYLDLILSSIGMTDLPQYYSLQSKICYDLDGNNQLTLNALYGKDFIEEVEEDDPESEEILEQDYFRHDGSQLVTGLTWRHLIDSRGYFKCMASQVRSTWDQISRENFRLEYRNQSVERERTVKTEVVVLPSASTELQAGASVKSVRFHIDLWAEGDTVFTYQYDPYGRIAGISPVQVYDPFTQVRHQDSYKAAAYVHGKWQPSARWTLLAGLRADYFDAIHDHAVDPRVGVRFHLSPLASINLALGQQSQAPHSGQVTAHALNADLVYKRTRQVVLGFDRLFREDIRGTVEVFYKDYQKVPVGISELTGDPFDVSNGRGVSQGEGFAKGIELFLQKKPTGLGHFTLSYAYAVSKARDPRNGRTYNWDYDYRHMFTAMGGIQLHLKNKSWYQRLGKNWIYRITAWLLPLGDEVELSCRWRYLGGRPYTRPVYHPEYRRWLLDEDVAINTHRYPAYHRLDIRLDRRFMFNGWNIVTYIDIMNVYNQKNIWDYTYRSNGNVETWDQFYFLPVGGITVEF
ncbi:TonB-dependent receptor [bacterium]|nr:TonB-dependent receptor [bacterium]